MAFLTLGAAALLGGLSLAKTGIGQAQQFGFDTALKKQQYEYDTALAEQKYGYDTQLAQQQYGYDTALSAQNAQQELAKQMQQQEYDKMMSDTEMQRKVADYQAAGINPAIATGGISTATGTGAQQATATENAPSKTNARENEKQAKLEILTTLATAYQSGILKVATKKIATMSQELAKQPNNNKLKANLKSYIFKTYNLMK